MLNSTRLWFINQYLHTPWHMSCKYNHNSCIWSLYIHFTYDFN